MEQELADVDVERHSEECNAYEAFETDDEAVSGKPRKKGPGMWRRCLRLLPALGLLSALGAGLVISGPFLKDWFSQLSQESSDQLTTTVATQLAGDGRTFPREGDLMVAHITGKLANGTEFFSSRAAGAPLHFTLHVGEVSLGLMIGLRKMSLGERSHVRVPKVLNYRGGWRTKEPAREDVEFDVQILVINGKPWDRLNVTAVETPGDGKHFPALGDTVYVAFECLLPDSTVADSTARHGVEAFRFVVGLGQVTCGMDYGIQNFSVGMSATLEVPSEMGFGMAGHGPIPPDSDLNFKLQLLGLEPRPQCVLDDCPTPPAPGGASVPSTAITAKAVTTTPVMAPTSASSVGIKVVLPGDGVTFPQQGDFVFVHYTGMLPDGTVFDSSRERPKPFHFQFSETAGLIKGWLDGMGQMSLGERAVLHVPSSLGYGPRAHGKIPANSDLDFDIQILAIGDRAWSRLNVSSVLRAGDGTHFPQQGDTVYINFVGYLAATGKKFDASRDHAPKPFRFSVGAEQLDYGMDFGVRLLSLGERAMLEVPSELAYGTSGMGPIPPNADLRWDIELLAIKSRPQDCFDDDCPPLPRPGSADIPEGAISYGGVPERTSTTTLATTSSVALALASASGVGIRVVLPGDGVTFPQQGDFVFVHYTGMLPDGTVFDSSRERSKPFHFQFSETAGLIKGWLDGMGQMSLGERAVLHVPSSLGYGPRAHGKIPANSDLDFDIQILAIGERAWSRLNVSSVLRAGDGTHFPQQGDTVYVNFVGYLAATGKKFDASRDHAPKPFRFSVGAEQLDYGMDFGVRLLSLGERAMLEVPSELAFGQAGSGPIPPNADLRWDMELLAIQRRPQNCFDDDCPPLPRPGSADIPPKALAFKNTSGDGPLPR